MATHKPKLLAPVKIDLPFRGIDSNIETRDFSTFSVLQANFAAGLHPKKGFPQPVSVKIGYGFYFLRAYNNGWTDNINAQKPGEYPRPLEGFPFEHKNQYIYDANRAQLVSLTGDGKYVCYQRNVDASLPEGKYAFANNGKTDWILYFYCNDLMGTINGTTDWYFDNRGSANCDIVVFRLP